MRKWQILEFDGKPYYAFVPENDASLDNNMVSDGAIEDHEQNIKTEILNSFEVKLDTREDPIFEYSSNDENAYEEFEELADANEAEVQEDDAKLNGTSKEEVEGNPHGNFFEVKVEDRKVLFQKFDLNLLNAEAATMEPVQAKDSVNYTIEKAIADKSLPESPSKFRKKGTRKASELENCTLKCKACSETFTSNTAFKKHVAWTHKKKIYVKENGAYICSVCDYRTLKKNLFAAHLQRKHETLTSKKQNSAVFPCGACGFECRSKHSLQSHFIRKHTDRYEHQCKFCPKKFKVKGDLTNHIRFHHKEKPINCDVCGKLCLNSGSLYVHQKWAHYKPKFECPICKRRMVTQENLDQHMVSQHEKREKIVCAECGKTFSKKDSFKRHMAVHTGNKPHACVICNKPFARRSQLRQHLLIHTGKRPFVCDICGKAFTQKPGLICHRKIHPGPHPPLPVMPIGDIVKEFTEGYYAETEEVEIQENE